MTTCVFSSVFVIMQAEVGFLKVARRRKAGDIVLGIILPRFRPAKIMNKNYRLPATVCALAVCLALCFAVAAWNEPAETPPGGNAAAPLNAGDAAQSKSGDLNIGAGLKYWISKIGDSFALKNDAGQVKLAIDQNGNLGLGVDAPAQKIDLGDDGTGAGGGRVVNVSLPVDDNDAATKKYVKAAMASGFGTCVGMFLDIRFTSAQSTGNLGGVGGADAKCAAEYPGYHMCRADELDEAGRSGCLPNPSQYRESRGWMHNESASNFRNCDDWTKNNGGGFVLVIDYPENENQDPLAWTRLDPAISSQCRCYQYMSVSCCLEI